MDGEKVKKPEMTLYCSICSQAFDYDEISLVLREKSKTIFHTTCKRCQASTLVTVTENSKGIMGVGMLTDLDQEEVMEKMKSSIISADEIIETYKVLNI